MTHRWGLDLDMTAVRLMRREAGHWHEMAVERIDGPDIADRLDAMIAQIDAGEAVELFLPRDQILFADVRIGSETTAPYEIDRAMDGRTPYPLDELEIDWELTGPGTARVAAIARETLDEATDFAAARGLAISGYSALADPEEFPRLPDWGGSAVNLLAEEDAGAEPGAAAGASAAETAGFASTRSVRPAADNAFAGDGVLTSDRPMVRVDDPTPVMRVRSREEPPLDLGTPVSVAALATPRIRTDIAAATGPAQVAASLAPPAQPAFRKRNVREITASVPLKYLAVLVVAALVSLVLAVIVWSVLPSGPTSSSLPPGMAAPAAPQTAAAPQFASPPATAPAPAETAEAPAPAAEPSLAEPAQPFQKTADLPPPDPVTHPEETLPAADTPAPHLTALAQAEPGGIDTRPVLPGAPARTPEALRATLISAPTPGSAPGGGAAGTVVFAIVAAAIPLATPAALPAGDILAPDPGPAPVEPLAAPGPVAAPAPETAPATETGANAPHRISADPVPGTPAPAAPSAPGSPVTLAIPDPTGAPPTAALAAGEGASGEPGGPAAADPVLAALAPPGEAAPETPAPRPLAPTAPGTAKTSNPAATGPVLSALASAVPDLRPRARPADTATRLERQKFGGLTLAQLAKHRPPARPESAQAIAQAQRPEAPVSEYAVAVSAPPHLRPRDFAGTVASARNQQAQAAQTASYTAPDTSAAIEAALADELNDPNATAVTSAPSAPTDASVARLATFEQAIRLNRISLVGVFGVPSDRRALIRLPSGRYLKVKVGDRLDGGTIAAITDSGLVYQKGSRKFQLEVPQG